MRMILPALLTLMLAAPALAQTAGSNESATTPPPTGQGGNGVTTSTTSAPEMKTGAERSPTAGAPTTSGVTRGDERR